MCSVLCKLFRLLQSTAKRCWQQQYESAQLVLAEGFLLSTTSLTEKSTRGAESLRYFPSTRLRNGLAKMYQIIRKNRTFAKAPF